MPGDNSVDRAQTLGELRNLTGREPEVSPFLAPASQKPAVAAISQSKNPQIAELAVPQTHPSELVDHEKFLYPRWPWRKPVAWLRNTFLEIVAQPLVWFLANPRVVDRPDLHPTEPMLIVCNHVTAYDGPLVQFALPGRVRRRIAVAMAGEMLEDYRHFRNPEHAPGQRRFMLFGPAAYYLVTALFNVFPLPRHRDVQRSFAHAGEALDLGYNVLVFPEGTRSAAGELARFRPGIGMLVKQSQAAVLPVAIRGLGELKSQGRGWFRSGKIEVRVGEPLRFAVIESETAITERLAAEVRRLLLES